MKEAFEKLPLLRVADTEIASLNSERPAVSRPQALIVSDIGLPDPGLSGLDIMKKALQVVEGVRGIAVSGFGTEQDEAASRQAGFLMHLIKPVTLQLLQEAIFSVLSLELPSKTCAG